MAKTSIEWADVVWNPVTGCTKVSAGCKNCYADVIAKRFWGERKFTDVRVHPERLDQLSHWRKPRRIFVNSMSDLFHEDVPDEFIWHVFDTMTRGNRRHTYMIMTKRPARMKAWFDSYQEKFWHYHAPGEPKGPYVMPDWPDPQIWLGVSVEDQKTANERIPLLLQTPAAVRFVSCEPLLGAVDLVSSIFRPGAWELTGGDTNTKIGLRGIDWLIVGGESGPHARPMHPDWARSLRDQCQAAGVPFFFKQWGEWQLAQSTVGWKLTGDSDFPAMHPSLGTAWVSGSPFVKVGKKAAGRLLDGREWNEYPKEA